MLRFKLLQAEFAFLLIATVSTTVSTVSTTPSTTQPPSTTPSNTPSTTPSNTPNYNQSPSTTASTTQSPSYNQSPSTTASTTQSPSYNQSPSTTASTTQSPSYNQSPSTTASTTQPPSSTTLSSSPSTTATPSTTTTPSVTTPSTTTTTTPSPTTTTTPSPTTTTTPSTTTTATPSTTTTATPTPSPAPSVNSVRFLTTFLASFAGLSPQVVAELQQIRQSSQLSESEVVKRLTSHVLSSHKSSGFQEDLMMSEKLANSIFSSYPRNQNIPLMKIQTDRIDMSLQRSSVISEMATRKSKVKMNSLINKKTLVDAMLNSVKTVDRFPSVTFLALDQNGVPHSDPLDMTLTMTNNYLPQRKKRNAFPSPACGSSGLTLQTKLVPSGAGWSLYLSTNGAKVKETIDHIYVRVGSVPYEAMYDWRLVTSEGADGSCLIDVDWKMEDQEMSAVFMDADIGEEQEIFVNVTRTNTSVGEVCVYLETIQPLQLQNGSFQSLQSSRVKATASKDKVAFKSNFMGSFKIDLISPPNTINFDKVFSNFSGRLSENPIALIVVIIFGVILLCAILLMSWLDRRDARRLATCNDLANNSSADGALKVKISVSTGIQSQTIQDAPEICVYTRDGGKMMMKLSPETGVCKYRPGSTVSFAANANFLARDITYVNVWRNRETAKHSWYLKEISFEEMTSADGSSAASSRFICEQWISGDHVDGQLSRLLPERSFDWRKPATGSVGERHVFVSLFRKPESSHFGRAQRTCVLGVCFFLLLINSAVWYRDGDGGSTGGKDNFKFKIGIVSVGWQEMLVSLVSMASVYPVVVLLAELFRRSVGATKCCRCDRLLGIRFPRWMAVVAWIVSLAIVASSSFFCVLYSLEWGRPKTLRWLNAFVLSLLECFLLTDPLMLIIFFLIYEKLTRSEKRNQKTEIPPPPSSVNEVRVSADVVDQLHAKRRVNVTCRSLVTQILCLMLVAAIASSNINDSFRQSSAVKQLLPLPRAENLRSEKSFYQWMHSSLLPHFYPTQDAAVASVDERKYVSGSDNVRLCPLQITQMRVKAVPCRRSLPGHSRPCVSSSDNLEKARLNVPLTADLYRNAPSPAEFRSNDLGERVAIDSNLGKVLVRGYSASLGECFDKSVQIAEELEKVDWINRFSTVVVIEAMLYNADTNLFTSAQYVLRRAGLGAFSAQTYVRSFSLYTYVGGAGIVTLLMQVIWGVVIVVSAVKVMFALAQQKCQYFFHKWNVVQLFVVVTSLVAVAVFVLKVMLTIRSIEMVMNNRGRFVSFDRLLFLSDVEHVLMGLICFALMMQLMQHLNLLKHIAILSSTLSSVIPQLMGFSVSLLIVLFSFLILGYLIFGFGEYQFRSPSSCFSTLLLSALGYLDFQDVFGEFNGAGAFLYYFCFVVLLMFIQLNMFISLLTDAYGVVSASSDKYDYDGAQAAVINEQFTTFYKFIMKKGAGNNSKTLLDADQAVKDDGDDNDDGDYEEIELVTGGLDYTDDIGQKIRTAENKMALILHKINILV